VLGFLVVNVYVICLFGVVVCIIEVRELLLLNCGCVGFLLVWMLDCLGKMIEVVFGSVLCRMIVICWLDVM